MAVSLDSLESLVKYDPPVSITTKSSKKKSKNEPTETESILNNILPPREWSKEGNLWISSVSSTPATRLDVINLQSKLDKKLLELQARETGICAVRESLYQQCFDELIRQITVNCSERGLLLLRVRDEIRMTTKSYQTLYESSVAFGIRKALRGEQEKEKLKQQIEDLKIDCKNLEDKTFTLQSSIEELEQTEAQKKQELKQRQEEEIQQLEAKVANLTEELEGALGGLPSKKKGKN